MRSQIQVKALVHAPIVRRSLKPDCDPGHTGNHLGTVTKVMYGDPRQDRAEFLGGLPASLLLRGWGLLGGRRRVRLLGELKAAGTAQDPGAFIPGAGALGVGKFGLDGVAIVVTLHGEDSMRLAMADCALGRQLSSAVVGYLAFDQQVAGLTGRAVLSAEVVVMDGAGKLPGVALGVPFGRASELGQPLAVQTLARKGTTYNQARNS